MAHTDYGTPTQPMNTPSNASWAKAVSDSIDALVASNRFVFTGTMFQYASPLPPPTGWLLCDGSAVSKATYAALYAVVQDNYGTGTATTFTLPNLKGKVPAGYDASDTSFNDLGYSGGSKTHTLVLAELPAHTHKMPTTSAQVGYFESPNAYSLGYDFIPEAPSSSTGGNEPHNNLQPYLVLNYIIKT